MSQRDQHAALLAGVRLEGNRADKLMRKAEALGMETRNVPTGYLAPLGRKGSPRNASMPHQQGRGGYSPAVFHEHLTPKAISQYKTAKMLQSIGQKAIFSNNPYVDTAVETLIHKGPGASNSPGEGPPPPEQEYSSSPRRPVAGKLPRKGAKAAAMKRAKRLVGAGAAFTPEVPLEDALRVADIEKDRTALAALLKAYVFSKPKLTAALLEQYAEALSRCKPAVALAAAALLMQAGYFFTALKAVYNEFEALRALLDEMRLLVGQHLDANDWNTAAATWNWKDPDREVFLNQFSDLRIIAYYLDVRKQLRALKEQGVVALARVEREMLLKVTQDFTVQLEEEYSAHQAALKREAEERARAKQRMEEQAKAAASAAAKRADEQAKAMARARAQSDVRSKKEAEAKAKAEAAERKRQEVLARAEEIKKAKAMRAAERANRQPRGKPAQAYALVQGDAAAMFKEPTIPGGEEEEDEELLALEQQQMLDQQALEALEAQADEAASQASAAVGGEASLAAPAADLEHEPGAPVAAAGPGSAQGSPRASGSPRATGSPRAAGSPRATGSRPGSKPGSVLGSRPGSQRVPGSAGGALGTGLDGTSPEDDKAALQEGIEELKRNMSESRKKADEMAAQLKQLSVSGGGSRPHTPAIRLNIQVGNTVDPLVEERLKALEEALEAERAAFAMRLEEERLALAQVLAEERTRLEGHMAEQKAAFDEERQRLLRELYEQQGMDIDAQLAASAQSVKALQEQRDALRSGGRPAGSARGTSGRTAAAAEEAARLEAAIKMLEKKLDDEVAHAKALEEEKTRVEAERQALDQARATLEVQKSQAELEKAKMEQEKSALQEQIAKTMRMFQEQLAQTVKMAAMLQAQRILGAATGGQAGSMAAPALPPPVMPLPHEIDEPPTREEILEYAKYLGIDVVEDADLLYIAEWALTAPLPEGWTVHLDGEGNEFFYNAATSASTYEHPMDEHYRQYYVKMKEQKQLNRMAAMRG